MNWNFGSYQYDDERGILSTHVDREIVETILEPKASALLKYFCLNPQRDISRDELIAEVWHGQIVSDNAINRVIVQLRKALGDESKPRSFIKTVPKVGYRFISTARESENNQIFSNPNIKSQSWFLPIFALLLMAAGLNWFVVKQEKPSATPISIQPVSRETGWQFDADLSPNQNHLLYSVNEERGNILYLQNLESGAIEQVSPDSGQAHGARWGHEGTSFVYTYHTNDSCAFHKVQLSKTGKIEANEILQSCRFNSDTSFALSLDDEILYFVERESVFSPFEAYALDMQEQQRWKLAQPLATSFGNHYLDVHPETGKVLLLSEPKPGKSAVYEIDVPANSYRKIQEFDYDLYSAIWGHDENTVVHPAEHPSYQLLETNVSTGESMVLVSDSRRISTPRRINNGEDYLFASYIYNRDIAVEGYEAKDFNSAVMDYLPEYSNAGEHLAFVSKRGGFSKILILEIASGQLRTLKSEDQGLTFYNLSWSPNDSRIAANTSKGILIYDLATDTQQLLDIEQLIYAVDWYDETSVTYSEHVNSQWQVYRRQVDTDVIEAIEGDAIFMQSADGVHLSIASGVATDSMANTYDLSQCSDRYLGRYQSNIKFDEGMVYCPHRGSVGNMLVIEAGQKPQVHSDQFEGVEYYSVSKGRSATAYPASASNDVMRTQH